MLEQTRLNETITAISAQQRFGVLATRGTPGPHTSLIAFAVSPDLQTVVFATPSATRKLANITACGTVSLLFDNRRNEDDLLYDTTAVSAFGVARVAGAHERDNLLELYLRRHPYLRTFLEKPDTVLVSVAVEYYEVVSRFQDVQRLAFKMSRKRDSTTE
jgi:heme iron utilization protein